MAQSAVPDDATLVARAAVGEQRALEELYRRYGEAVFGLAVRITGSRESAEEVTQDVFDRVWRRAATYHRDRASVGTWILGIARNRSIDEARRSGRRPTEFLGAWEESLAADIQSDPGHTAGRAMERDRVRAAVLRLPAGQRRALELAFFGGLSHIQIAKATGLPVGTIKTRIRLALRKVRVELDGPEDPGARARRASGREP